MITGFYETNDDLLDESAHSELMSVLLPACGSAVTFVATTSAKPVNIEVGTNPSLVMIGDPIEGATVDVSAEHTDMSGMDMSGVATEEGSGKYAINANFGMSGTWKLKVYFRKEGLDYSEEIDLPIQ